MHPISSFDFARRFAQEGSVVHQYHSQPLCGPFLEVSSIESPAMNRPTPLSFYRFELLCGFAEFAGFGGGVPN